MDEKESILRRTKGLEELSKEQYADLYRTKDIYCAAFLISRGLEWSNLELVETIKKNSKFGNSEQRKKWIFFLFPDKSKCYHTALHFFNPNRINLNVNANTFVQSILTVRSIITDPPF